MKFYNNLVIFGIFLIVFIFIVGINNIFGNGTIFLLDYITSPIYELSQIDFLNGQIIRTLLSIFAYFFGYEIVFKLFYFGIIISSIILGVLYYYFVKSHFIENKQVDKLFIFLGLIFTFNPFFYERMLTQPGIYLGFVFLGFGILFLLKNIFKNNLKNFILVGLFFGLAINIMLHSVFMIFVILFFYLILFFSKTRFLGYLIVGIFIMFINGNFLISYFFLGNENFLTNIGEINNENIFPFRTNGINNFSPEFSSLILYGFWAERYNHFFQPFSQNKNFYIAGIVVVLISIFGLIKIILNNKTTTIGLYLTILGIISYVLGVGNSSDFLGFISNFLYENIPYYIGLREPQKWIGILQIVFGIGFIVGIINLFDFIIYIFGENKYLKSLYIFLIFLLLNAWTPNILSGFNGQLFLIDYPDEFFDARHFLIQKNEYDKKIVIFPWHQYQGCMWTKGKIVGNQFKNLFYPLNTIVADNIEVGNLYSNSSNNVSKDVEMFLKNKNVDNLTNNKIKYIIYLKFCADYNNYKFLDEVNNIGKLFEKGTISVYEIKNN